MASKRATAVYGGVNAGGYHIMRAIDGDYAGTKWCIAEDPPVGEVTIEFEPDDQFCAIVSESKPAPAAEPDIIDKIRALTDAWQNDEDGSLGAVDTLLAIADLVAPCKHEPDFANAAYAEGDVFDVPCGKCGRSGSFRAPKDMSW